MPDMDVAAVVPMPAVPSGENAGSQALKPAVSTTTLPGVGIAPLA